MAALYGPSATTAVALMNSPVLGLLSDRKAQLIGEPYYSHYSGITLILLLLLLRLARQSIEDCADKGCPIELAKKDEKP